MVHHGLIRLKSVAIVAACVAAFVAAFLAGFVAWAAPAADGPAQTLRPVTVGVPKSFPPYYQLDVDGKPSGFAVAVMDQVAALAGLKVTYRVAENGGANFMALRAGEIDIIPSLGISDHRQQYVAFTNPVDTFRVVLFVRSDTQGVTSIDDMVGRQVAVVSDNVGFRFLEKGTDVQLVVFPKFADALFALLSAKVDGFIYPEPVTWKLAREAKVSGQIKVAAKPLFEIKRAMAVRKDRTKLLAVLDLAVNDFVASPEYQQTYVAWFGKPDPYWTVTRVAWAMGVALAVILIFMAWWRYRSVVSLNRALYKTIAERKLAEDKANNSAALLQTSLENMGHGICVFDADRKVVAYNKPYLQMALMPEDLDPMGLTYEQILHYRAAQGVLDEEELQYRLLAIKDDHEAKDRETTHPDGTVLIYHREPMPDGGLVVTYTDITERRQAEEKFRTVFEHVTAGSIAINGDGIIELFNSAAEDIFGYTADEMIGENVGMLMPEPDRGNHDGYIRRYFETGDAKIIGFGREVSGRRKNGEEFPMHLGVGEMTSGCKTSFIASITDLTEIKTLEQNLHHAQRLEAVGQLTGGIAHDFNNEMSVMNFNIEMLRDQIGEDPLAKRNLDRLELAVDHASSLTDRMLAFSRQQLLTPRVTNINRLIMELEDMLRSTLEETIDLKITPADGVWPVMIDPSQLENTLVNLAVNARDAMTQGGTLTIEAVNFTLDGANARQHEEMAPGDYVNITVSDTGTGIAPDILEKVFEPFFTTKDVGKGSGLGLSMVYGFVKQSQGHITIDSQLDRGTAIRLYLPRSRQALTQEDIKDDTREFAPASERILVVEDDPSVREGPVNILRNQGYQVVEAGDGKEAIACLRDVQPFDLLFTDMVLPGGMSGIEIAEEAKQLQPDIKVLFTTGYTEDTVSPHGKLEADLTLINKPYRRAELLSRVLEILDGHGS